MGAAGPSVPRDIRAQVDNDTALDAPTRTFVDRLMFWKPAPPPGTQVDATREAARLRQNAALGTSPEAGDTPIIQPKKQGFLSSLF